MREDIYYSLPSRDEIMKRAVRECLDTMFRLATPSTSLETLEAEYKEMPAGNDEIIQDRYYLPMDLQSEIVDHFLDVYRMDNRWENCRGIIEDFVLEETSMRVPKSSDPDADLDAKLGIKSLPAMKELIGDDAVEKLRERFRQCAKTYYRCADEETFRWSIFNMSPMSNKERVEEYWRSHGQPDFTIDDSKYNDEYEDENNGEE